MDFYKKLPINLRITIKGEAINIGGLEFSLMREVLGFRKAVDTLVDKMIMEGII